MKKYTPLFIGLLLALAGLSGLAEAEISEETLEKEHRSRYHINYAGYLIDVGKYLEALESYEAAEELTTIDKTKVDALLAKATLLTSFLDAPEEALKVYRNLQKDYPQAAEISHYREGMLLYHLKRLKEAQSTLESYSNAYPNGRFRFQTDTLLREVAKAPPAVEPASPKAPVQPAPKTPKPPGPSGTTVPAPPVPKPAVVPTTPAPPKTPPAPVVPAPTPTPATQPRPALDKHPMVRVRMCQTTHQAKIEGKKVCADALGCKDSYTLSLKDGKIHVNGSRSEEKSITFTSEQPLTIICGKKKKQVRGVLKAGIRKGKLLVTNVVDIEDYLLSVVPSENPASWPLETLKAQAVAARTYAYYQREHRKNWAYDLVDYAGDQAYEGMKKEHKRSTQAVKATAGEVLTHKGKPILAMYSANSGGYTADSQAIFNLHKPYLVAQKDPASMNGGMANWTRKFKVSEVVAKLGKIRIDAKGLSAIEAHERGPSGRIVKVRLVLKGGKTKVLRNRTTLRRALNLPEILHKIRLESGTYIFEGHGWGHGVGYSQWGSAYLGKKKKYKEILSFYYGEARMEKMW